MDTSFIPKPITKFFGRQFFSLPDSIKKKLAGKPITIDGNTLDVNDQIIAKYFAMPNSTLHKVDKARNFYDHSGNLLGHKIGSDIIKNSFVIPGTEYDIPCERYQPKALTGKDLTVLIYFHGGGHVIGSIESHRPVCTQLALESNCVVIAANYRKAPEHKFPAGITDSFAVYDYVVANASELGINPNRIAIGGESAGANITAVIAQQRKQCAHPPFFQLLIVPWVDMSKQSNSYTLFASGFFANKEALEWYTEQYINTPEDTLNPMVSPLLGDVNGVCDAAVVVAGFDPLRDEGLAYAKKLKNANVPTTVTNLTTSIHPFINFAGYVPSARKSFEKITQILNDKFQAQ